MLLLSYLDLVFSRWQFVFLKNIYLYIHRIILYIQHYIDIAIYLHLPINLPIYIQMSLCTYLHTDVYVYTHVFVRRRQEHSHITQGSPLARDSATQVDGHSRAHLQHDLVHACSSLRESRRSPQGSSPARNMYTMYMI